MTSTRALDSRSSLTRDAATAWLLARTRDATRNPIPFAIRYRSGECSHRLLAIMPGTPAIRAATTEKKFEY